MSTNGCPRPDGPLCTHPTTDLREPRGERLFDHAGEDGGRLGRAEVGQEGALHVLHRVHRHARDAGRGHLNEEEEEVRICTAMKSYSTGCPVCSWTELG